MIKFKIVLEKIKLQMEGIQIANLLKLIEMLITAEQEDKSEAAFIHIAWIALLQEIFVKLVEKEVTNGEVYKVSLTLAQYMALMDLCQYRFHETYKIDANEIYSVLVQYGVNHNLITLKGGEVSPLMLGKSSNHNNLLER